MLYIQEFPRSVIEKLEYYVYLLIDPETNQVFYVGKGSGNRLFAHLNAALTDAVPSENLDQIRALHACGFMQSKEIGRSTARFKARSWRWLFRWYRKLNAI